MHCPLTLCPQFLKQRFRLLEVSGVKAQGDLWHTAYEREDFYVSGAEGSLWDSPCNKRRTSLAEHNSIMQA